MPLYQLADDVFFNLFHLFDAGLRQSRVDLDPIFDETRVSGGFWVWVRRDEDNLEFTLVKIVSNDDLVTIAFECCTSLGYQEIGVRF